MVVSPDEVDWPDEEICEPDPDQYPISASAVKSHRACPEKFRLKYIEGLDGTTGGSPYATLGTAVHESIEEILAHDADLKDKPNQLKQMFLGRYREKDPDIPDDMYDTGTECLEVAARYVAMRDVDHWKGIEQDFTFALAREDINHSFRGVMDVATDREIWDWKTGKNHNEQEEIIQGMIYAFGYYQRFGKVPNKVRFVYLRKEKERAIEPNDENWNTFLDHVRNVIEAKNSGVYEPDPEPSKCYWCSREGYCSASSVGVGNVRWEVF